MLAPNEKRLLYILCVVLVLTAAAGFIFIRFFGPGGYSEKNAQIIRIEKELQNLLKDKINPEDLPKKIAEIDKLLATEKDRVYKQGEIDISGFGIQVRRVMMKNRISEQSLRTITNNNLRSLQFQFNGSAYDLGNFFKDISTYEKYWKIEELLFKTPRKGSGIDVIMRITYETANP